MSVSQRHILVLAAGMGTRMKSSLPKILHPVAHQPLVGHVLTQALTVSDATCHIVIPDNARQIEAYLADNFSHINTICQPMATGTGHAVQCALPYLPTSGHCVILFGDTPLIQSSTINSVFTQLEAGASAVVVGMYPHNPSGYGRLIVDITNDHVIDIIEDKNATPKQRALTLCNSGIMGFDLGVLHRFLPTLLLNTLTQEFYLTDLMKILTDNQLKCHFQLADFTEVSGVNTRADLAYIEHHYQHRKRHEMMLSGVTLIDPNSVYFAHDTIIQADVLIEPQVFFGPHVTVHSGTIIKAFSHIEGAVIYSNARVGPFARLRPGTILHNNTRVGNFVEIKKSTLGEMTKVNHLSYIGDTVIGTNGNIGAGTITCNYDGYRKFNTVVGNDVFIGSNTALIAPVMIGDEALIAAGSLIAQDVVAGDLAITCAELKTIKQGGRRFRQQSRSQVKDKK